MTDSPHSGGPETRPPGPWSRSKRRLTATAYRSLYGSGMLARVGKTLRMGSRVPFLRRVYWKVQPFLRPSTVDIGGLRFHVHRQDGVVSDHLLTRGTYEPFETALLARLLQPGDVFLDIGANIGYHTLHASRIVGNAGHVVSVEPARDNLQLLRQNIAENGLSNITVLPVAAGQAPGRLSLFEDEENKGDHRSYEIEGRSSYEVDVAALDDELGRLRLRPRVVKIDIQGFEYYAVKGLERTIREADPLLLFTEYWTKGLRSAGVDPPAYIVLLQDLGLTLYEVDEWQQTVTPLLDEEMLGTLTGSERCTNLLGVKGVDRTVIDTAIRSVPSLATVPGETEAQWVTRTAELP